LIAQLPVVALQHLLSCRLKTLTHAAVISCRSLQAFDLRTKLYAGHISSVYRAVDKKSGITVGLKLYK
jgi:hypothetical protein